jgi:hypothetical protein
MLRGACVRHAAWRVGGVRAVFWHWAGGSLPLPQTKAPTTVARRVILIEPEPHWQGSGSFALRGGGGSRKMAVALLSVHTPSKNPRPILGMQAYIAYILGKRILRTSA